MNLNDITRRLITMSGSVDIFWRKDAKYENITHAAFNEILEKCKTSGIAAKNKTKDPNWAKLYTYFYIETEREKRLFYHSPEGYKCVWANRFELTGIKKHGKNGGTGAINALNTYHKKRTGHSLRDSFGYSPKEVRRCVPKNFYWDNFKDYPCGVVYHDVSSIDGCSQYPSGFLGSLPDANTAEVFPGTVEPSAEYPFAFYVNSGHLAIYKELDTHDWCGSSLWFCCFKMKEYTDNKDTQNPFLDRMLDITILMKAAKNDMADDYQHFFKIKETYKHDSEEYKTAKLVMNASIGMMHRNDKDKDYEQKPYRFAHLAAVALARANNSILKMAKKIGYKNILQIMVDGIVYIGPNMGQTTKELGKYQQEISGEDYMAVAHGVYAFRNRCGEITKYKHLGRDIWKDGTPIDDKAPERLEDIYLWEREKQK